MATLSSQEGQDMSLTRRMFFVLFNGRTMSGWSEVKTGENTKLFNAFYKPNCISKSEAQCKMKNAIL